MIKYRTNCGMDTKGYKKDKGKIRDIYLQKKLIDGEAIKGFKEWNMNKQCIGCKQVKTRTEDYLNADNGSTYKCEVKYCVAKKITVEQQLEELKKQYNELLEVAKEVEKLVKNGVIVNSLDADEKETLEVITKLRKTIKKD